VESGSGEAYAIPIARALAAVQQIEKGTSTASVHVGPRAVMGISIRQDYLPEQYWSGGTVRDTTMDTFLQTNVTNPFYIGTPTAPSPFYASLLAADPLLPAPMIGASHQPATAPSFPRCNPPGHRPVLQSATQVIKNHSLGSPEPPV
jgi:hypothetical protein